MANGYIYVMTIASDPGLRKIGFTDRHPTVRARKLDTTGSPYPLVVEYFVGIQDAKQHEQLVHKALAAKRHRKEWFRCTESEARVAVDAAVAKLNLPWLTPKAELEAKRRREEADAKRAIRLREQQEAAQRETERKRDLKEREQFWRKHDEEANAWPDGRGQAIWVVGYWAVAALWVVWLKEIPQSWRGWGVVLVYTFLPMVVWTWVFIMAVHKAVGSPERLAKLRQSPHFRRGRP